MNDARRARAKSSASKSLPTHPIRPGFVDSNPPPKVVDQFTPTYSKKTVRKKITVSKNTKGSIAPQPSTKFLMTQSVNQKGSTRIQTEPSGFFGLTGGFGIAPTRSMIGLPSYKEHLRMEETFDSIVSSSSDKVLSKLVEHHMKKYFDAEEAFYFHELSSVQILYCSTLTKHCPHGSGLIGYTQFTRRILNVNEPGQHVQFNNQYDGQVFDPDAHVLLFPLFDSQDRVQAVVVVARLPSQNPFNNNDEKSVEYFQKKFRTYSRWIFQPLIDDDFLTSLVDIQRLSPFIDSVTDKLNHLFNCKQTEIWFYRRNTKEICQYMSHRNYPIVVPSADAGIIGYSLMNQVTVSLVSCNTHAAYHARSDAPGEQSVLAMPFFDQDSPNTYGIILRGKRIPTFFTDHDEKILAKISPLIIASLYASESIERSFQSLDESTRTQKRLQSLLDVASNLSGQLKIDSLIPSIMNKACELVNADRCSLFMVNETREKLVTSFQGGLANAIEIPINSGIVGYTATTGQNLNIRDAYEDPRFSRATDLATGYQTKSVLCIPIFDENNNIRGVTEMINKVNGVFDLDDEKLIKAFNVFVGISIENARLYRASIDLALQLHSILQVSQSIASSQAIKTNIEEILHSSRKVIGAGSAILFMVSNSEKGFDAYAIDEDIDLRMNRLSKTNQESNKSRKNTRLAIIHKMMQGNDNENSLKASIEDTARNELIKKALDTKTSILQNVEDSPEDSIIVVPVLDQEKTPLAIITMQSKMKEPNFTQDELNLLESFAIFISISLERTRMKAIATYGAVELALQDKMSEVERKETRTPPLIKLKHEDVNIVFSRDFSITDWKDKTYLSICFAIFDIAKLRKPFKLTNELVFSFVYTLMNKYKKVPYHNWTHAVDVTLFMSYMIRTLKLTDYLTRREILALVVSCFCHDAGHDGFSNEYNVKAHTPLGILFKNQSVMETHHCTIAIRVISRDKCNLFHTMSENDVNTMWETIISLILSTDMAVHFDLMKSIEELKQSGSDWKTNEKSRLLVMKLLIKCADISNVTRIFELADKWCDVLCEEFFVQNENQKSKQIDVTSPVVKNEEARSKERAQIGFYTNVCLPLFEILVYFFPKLNPCVDQIKSNLEIWTQRANNNESKHKSPKE